MLLPTFYQQIQRQIDKIGYTGHDDIIQAPLTPEEEYHAPVPVHGEGEWYQNFMFVGEDRIQRYADFIDMDGHPLMSSALDIYAEESSQRDAWGNVVQVVSSDQVIKDELHNLLFKRLNINYSMFRIIRETCKYGDKFQYIVLQKDKKGILFLKDLPVNSVWRLEWNGKLLAFVQQTPQGITPPLDPFSLVHWRIALNQENYKPYGTSIFEPCRRHYRQLKLMEDAMVVYRITRAPERRVFSINCGRLPLAQAEAYMKKIVHRFRKRPIINPSSGEIDWRTHTLGADEDFYIPIRDGSDGTKIDTLPGAQNLCLSLETKIPLLDGRNIPLKQIIEEYNTGKENWGYSVNPDNGECVPGKITWAGITRKNAEIIKLTFDNGESLICTPDHKIPTQLKGKIEAKNLEIGDSLFAFQKNLGKTTIYHKIVKIEKLKEKEDTGTITIDGNEIYHNYHTFAVSAGIFVCNSEITDVGWFKDQILAYLKIPRVYLQDTDGGSSERRENLAVQDIRFAKTIERVQSQVLEGLTKICIIHLLLRGYDKHKAINFQLQSSAPSYAHERAEQEVENGRLTLADQYFGAGFPREYVWERVMKLTREEIRKLMRQRRKEDLILAEREAQVEAYRTKATQYYEELYADKWDLVTPESEEDPDKKKEEPPEKKADAPQLPKEPYGSNKNIQKPPKVPDVFSKTTTKQTTTRQKETESEEEPDVSILHDPSNKKLKLVPNKTKQQIEEDFEKIKNDFLGEDGIKLREQIFGKLNKFDKNLNNINDFNFEDKIRRSVGPKSTCHISLISQGELLPLNISGGIENTIQGKTNDNSIKTFKQLQKSQHNEWIDNLNNPEVNTYD